MNGMYGQGGTPQGMGAAPLPQNIMQQSPGDISGQRDRITQALMDVQNPPPVTPMAQQQGMPAATGAPPMAGAMPGAAAPQAMGAVPGQMPAGGAMTAPLAQMGSGVNTSGYGLGSMPPLQQGGASGALPDYGTQGQDLMSKFSSFGLQRPPGAGSTGGGVTF